MIIENYYSKQRTIRLRKAPQDRSRRLWGLWGAVDYTSALQAGKFQNSVVYKQKNVNHLFTVVFTHSLLCNFTVLGNIPSDVVKEFGHTVKENKIKKFLDSVTRTL